MYISKLYGLDTQKQDIQKENNYLKVGENYIQECTFQGQLSEKENSSTTDYREMILCCPVWC